MVPAARSPRLQLTVAGRDGDGLTFTDNTAPVNGGAIDHFKTWHLDGDGLDVHPQHRPRRWWGDQQRRPPMSSTGTGDVGGTPPSPTTRPVPTAGRSTAATARLVGSDRVRLGLLRKLRLHEGGAIDSYDGYGMRGEDRRRRAAYHVHEPKHDGVGLDVHRQLIRWQRRRDQLRRQQRHRLGQRHHGRQPRPPAPTPPR